MFSNASFSELTFSGNRSATRTFNFKVIGLNLYIQQDPRVFLNVIEVESPRFVYEITLQ